MNAFGTWELEPAKPVSRRDGDVIAAEFTNGGARRLATLDITRIRDGRRERIATYEVSGKREARAVAATLNAKPWNF